MRDIEGIEKVIAELRPHWADVQAHFELENEQFKHLLNQEHDSMARILKCHLIVEHYLDRYLSEGMGLQHMDDARLSFFQKAVLLPRTGAVTAFIRPGVLKLNTIRNRFAHSLQVEITDHDLEPINVVLGVARSETLFANAIERVEAFTTIACTWLIVPPPRLADVFRKAFAEVWVSADIS